jgi:hypothetical protein
MTHRPLTPAVSAYDAAEASPSLAHLARIGRESRTRLVAILPLIPEALRPALQAGPLDEKSWCLMVSGNAAAAKVRQIMPNLQAQLETKGLKVNAIRLKILLPRR